VQKEVRNMKKGTLRYTRVDEEWVPRTDQGADADSLSLEELIRESESIEMVDMPTQQPVRAWLKTWTAVASAVVVGLLLGLIGFASFVKMPSAVDSRTQTIAAKSYAVVQAGVFSQEAAAEVMRRQLLVKGIGAVVDRHSDKRFRVLIAVALNRNQALGITPALQQKGVTSYISDLVLPSVQTSAANNWFYANEQFSERALALIWGQIAVPSKSIITPEAIQMLGNWHAKWADDAHTLLAKASKRDEATIVAWSKSQQTVLSQLKSYLDKKDLGALWQAQTAVLRAILAEQSFRQSH
jgi:hypothetical protein